MIISGFWLCLVVKSNEQHPDRKSSLICFGGMGRPIIISMPTFVVGLCLLGMNIKQLSYVVIGELQFAPLNLRRMKNTCPLDQVMGQLFPISALGASILTNCEQPSCVRPVTNSPIFPLD